MKDVWKPIELRHKYIQAVVDKLLMEGKTHVAIADVANLLRDAFQVEAAADLQATYYLITANKEKIEGPYSYTDAINEASRMADTYQSDVLVLQHFDDYVFFDF